MISENFIHRSKTWNNLSFDEKKKLVQNEILSDEKTSSFEIYKIDNDGKIKLKINESISASIRGMLLLDLEEKLKKNIDQTLTIWLEPLGDKSKLRNLRGIKMKSI